MKNSITSVLSLFGLIACLAVQGQTNPGFEEGLKGWTGSKRSADVSIVKANQKMSETSQASKTSPASKNSDASKVKEEDLVYKGNAAVRLGKNKAEVSQRIMVGPLALVQIFGFGKVTDTSTKGVFFIRYYDNGDRLLLISKSKPISNLIYTNEGIYTETPAGTKYMVAGVSKSAGTGYLYADEIEIKTNMGEPAVKPKPLADLDQYMQPFWKSDTIFNETVLLYSEKDEAAEGKLLFQPDKILSVKSFDEKTDFQEGKTGYQPGIDFNLAGKRITRTRDSKIPFRADTSFHNEKGYGWYNLQSQWVVVTYTHHDQWDGPTPVFKGDQLPNTLAKLKSGRSLSIAALGMSITRGMDVSGYDLQPPYMPTYVDLFARELKKNCPASQINVFNAGLPGSKIDWGAKYTDEYINALKPDLVILDFGMNDFWQYTPEEYKGYMQTIIGKLKKANTRVEIILLSNMKFDPDYLLDSDPKKQTYQGNLAGYNTALQSLQTKGIVNLDMTSISDHLFKKKKAKDCITNPLHPNDYMARWIAQGLAALLIP